MERYELANGKVYELIRWSDMYAVVNEDHIVCSGTYAECRKYINKQK